MQRKVRKIVIVGGGTAGWMTAASLSGLGQGMPYSIELVESEEIGTVGVGEATIPPISQFNRALNIDENEFMRATQASFKLGIEFVDWWKTGEAYIHPFGIYGVPMHGIYFHHFWLRHLAQGGTTPPDAFNQNIMACRQGRFGKVLPGDRLPIDDIVYAYHFDAGLYAKFLRSYAEARGVRRTEGKVVSTAQRADGFIESVTLASGEVISGDLFIDCSGFRGLLIEQIYHAGYDDWSHWLLCNSAVAVPSENVGPPTPYVRCTGRKAGWTWRIPLQHRTGNGYVYSNKHISDDEAASSLLSYLDGRALADPRVLRFTAGRRKKSWIKNCVAIGLSSGFLEPLESTSIFLIQSGVMRLLSLFPDKEFSDTVIDRYNDQAAFEIERIRDFIILHFCATERDDSAFWNHVRTMDIPESLRDNIRLFRDSGRFYRNAEEMFAVTSWVQVMIGQRIRPQKYHPLVDRMSDDDLRQYVGDVKKVIASCVDVMPPHEAFIARYCAAEKV